MHKTFWSRDREIGVEVDYQCLEQMLLECVQAAPNETGGVLCGAYSPDRKRALVRHVHGPTPDSRSGPTWFHRGTSGLQEWLDTLWADEYVYLGEWHFHPDSEPTTSQRDIRQMNTIAESQTYSCPEPLLLIVGGHPLNQWSLGAFVFRRGKLPLSLIEDGELQEG